MATLNSLSYSTVRLYVCKRSSYQRIQDSSLYGQFVAVLGFLWMNSAELPALLSILAPDTWPGPGLKQHVAHCIFVHQMG